MSYEKGFEDSLELSITEVKKSKTKKEAVERLQYMLGLIKERKLDKIKQMLGVIK